MRSIASRTATATARPTARPHGKLPAPIVRLDTPGDYPHNGLSGFAFDYAGNVYFGLGENLGADYRLIGSDGTTLSRRRRRGQHLPLPARWHEARAGRHRVLEPVPHGVRRRSAGSSPSTTTPTRARPAGLLHIVEGGDYGYRFRNGRKGLHPFTAWNGELPGTLGMVAGTGEAPSGVVAYESDNLPDDYRGTLLVTSWGDHRIERYRLEPHGASFRSVMKPVVVGRRRLPAGRHRGWRPTARSYISDWVDKSYDLHGKGRIWRLRSAQRKRPAVARAIGQAVTAVAGLTPQSLQSLAAAGKLARMTSIARFVKSESADVRALAARILPAGRHRFESDRARRRLALGACRGAAPAGRSGGQGRPVESARIGRSVSSAGGPRRDCGAR